MGRPKTLENAENINIRVNGVFKAKVKSAADAVGQSLSDWVVETLRHRIEGGEDAKPKALPKFDPQVEELFRQSRQVEPIQPKAVVAAAMSEAPFGKSVTEFLESQPKAKPYSDPENWPTDEVPTLEVQERGPSWSEVFAKAKKEGDFGAEYFGEQTAHIARWPPGFSGWPQPKQVAWLDEKHPRKAE